MSRVFRNWMMEPIWKSKYRTAITCVLLLAGIASAVTRTWTGAGGNNNWSTTANWGGAVPAAGDDIVFSGSTRLSPVNDLTPGISFNSITFNSSAAAFNVTGNSVTLAGGSTAIACNVTGGTVMLGIDITFSTS